MPEGRFRELRGYKEEARKSGRRVCKGGNVFARSLLEISDRTRLEPVDLGNSILNGAWTVGPEDAIGDAKTLKEEIHVPFWFGMG